MEKLFESKFIQKLQEFSQKFQQIHIVSAISGALVSTIGILMVGSFFQIFATVLTLIGWISPEHWLYSFFMAPYDVMLGLLGLYMAFLVGYNYGNNKGQKPLVSGILSLAIFFMVVSPVTANYFEDGSYSITMNAANLNAGGSFIAMVIAFATVQVTSFFQKHNIVIKMPEAVPEYISDQFTAILPMVANVLIWQCISLGVTNMTGYSIVDAFNMILMPLVGVVDTIPGILFVGFGTCLLWCFGIHGSLLFYPVAGPVFMAALANNAQLVAAGQAPVFSPILLYGAITCMGGDGNPIPLLLLGLRAKSKQLKTISRGCLIPSLFIISEPTVFGLPIMYNPLLAIPFCLATVVTMLIVWVGYLIGLFLPEYIYPGISFVFVNTFLGSLNVLNLLIPVIALVVGLVIFYPFVKAYDKQLLEEERKKELAAE